MWSASELSDGGRGKGGEEADEIAIEVTQQQRPVTPGQRGGLADEVPMAETRRQQPSGHARDTDHRTMCCHSLEPDNASEDT